MAENKFNMLYAMSFFLSASHWVVYQGKKGEVHQHIWELELLIKNQNTDNRRLELGFADIDNLISPYLDTYEGVCLNDFPPFDKIMPTTENMGQVFYQGLNVVLKPYGLFIAELRLKETPTRGIIIRDYESEQVKREMPLFMTSCTEQEAAAVLEEPAASETVVAAGEVLEESYGYGNIDKSEKDNEPQSWLVRMQDAIEKHSSLFTFIAIATVLAANAFVYHDLLVDYPARAYPWGSDAWGHLYKAEFLLEQIKQGNFWPSYFPWWYNGIQLFRYWAPLPYYVLAGMGLICKDIFLAHIWYIIGCSLLGSISWLAMRKYTGYLPVLIIALLWVIVPDNISVTFSEGNLPRMLIMAITPIIVYLALEIYHGKADAKKQFGFVLLLAVSVLTHAMMGAILTGSICLWYMITAWFDRKPWTFVVRFLILSACGILVTSWWLFPALTGGITSIDSGGINEAIRFFPLSKSLNPLLRMKDPEVFYLGLSYAGLLVFGLLTWKSRRSYQKSALLIAALFFLATTTVTSSLYLKLPLHNLLWPQRLTTAGIALLLLGTVNFDFNVNRPALKKLAGVIFILLVPALFIDSYLSHNLIHLREYPQHVARGIETAATHEGFKVAAVDLSEFGSMVSYLFSSEFEREQVFGWAWQGAQTSSNIALANTAIKSSWYNYALDRLEELGATQLLVKRDTINNYSSFTEAARDKGYQQVFINDIAAVYSVNRGPYACTADYKILGIGPGANFLSVIYPQIQVGQSTIIEDYPLQKLKEYDALVLSGFDWRTKDRAEQRIVAYLHGGGRVIVDLNGVKCDMFSSRPSFLGVEGEPLALTTPVPIYHDKPVNLQSFDEANLPWMALTLQGLDVVKTRINYRGQIAAIGGYKQMGAGSCL
ncbi:MAG: 6-pyruvoyl-tetrahydropterin synthase-related protein [Syntrophomonadaceae bacterium]|nr:6-pyruvoyl-tetrahydropterin synthase-related protein [Syntrophomonadaceae bacterium]